jgi:hypothetical protein
MATSANFNGQTINRPGAYAATKSAIQNPVSGLSNGNVLLLDTGFLGADGFGAGSGVLGELKSGSRAVSTFTGIDAMRAAVRGGLSWLLAKPLFQPNGPTSKGAPRVLYLRAAETTAAKLTLTLASGGKLPLVAVNEGTAGNGILLNGELVTGVAVRLIASPSVAGKFVLELYAGTFKGLDQDGEAHDFVAAADSVAQRLVSSPSVATVDELVTWLSRDKTALQFVQVAKTGTVAGAIAAADVVTLAGYNLLTGGTITYSEAAFAEALLAIANLDYTFALSDNYGADAQSANNTALLAHLLTKARYEKIMVVAGGANEDEFAAVGGSLDTAAYFDSQRVTVVHAGLEMNRSKGGTKTYSQLYKAAAYLGMRASKAPQVPGTFKPIAMDGDAHELNADQVAAAQAGGLLCSVWDQELQAYVILRDINSLQGARNQFLVNEDGTSYENSIALIGAAVNKQLLVKAKTELFSQADGVNRNTLSTLDVQQWLEGQLDKMTANTTTDNLITYADTIVVTLEGDAYNCSYRFEPNFPINYLFFTGFMIDRSAQ